MSEDEFYDDNWKRLLRQQPLVARKIEALRFESVGYEEFEAMRKRVEKLENKISVEKEDDIKEDFEQFFWEEFQGAKGPFQQTNKRANNNSKVFLALQAILKEHRGFYQIDGYNYWFDNNDPDIINRRKK